MKNFEQANKALLKYKLFMLGWRVDEKAKPCSAGQLHSWFVPSLVSGFRPRRMTLRNAAKVAGLVR